MIDELGSYSLSDFLLFSQDTYFRLFELYNRDVWPLQIAAIALGFAMLWLVRRGSGRNGARIAAGILALTWVWVGWAFFLERYATINPAASYFAALFGLEALLLMWFAVVRGRLEFAERRLRFAGFVMVAFAILLHPFIGLLAGREWTAMSIFGLGPDPTAMATLGAVSAVRGWQRWLVSLPAMVWCVVSALTAAAMGSPEGIAPAVFAGAVVVAGVWQIFERLSDNESNQGDTGSTPASIN